MIDRFDHAAIAVADLSEAVDTYRRLGFEIRVGGHHVGQGTRNAIIRFGLDYLELLAVENKAEAWRSELNGPPLLGYLEAHRGGLIGYALATSSVDEEAERFGQSGMRGFTGLTPVGPIAMQRQRPDGTQLAWRLLVPGGVPWRRPWPFLIQWDTPESQRLEWEPPAAHPNGASGIAGIAVAVANLETASSIYQDQLGLRVERSDEVPALAARRITYRVGGCEIQLVTSEGDGPVQRILQEEGEGPFELTLTVADLDRTHQALAEAGATPEELPEDPRALRIPLEQAYGVRLVFMAPSGPKISPTPGEAQAAAHTAPRAE